MKTIAPIFLVAILCLGVGGCWSRNKFVGVWEGKLGGRLLASSSRRSVFAKIERAGGADNKFRVRTFVKTEMIPINRPFEKISVLSNRTAVLEGDSLRFPDGSTAEVDAKTGKLHMDGTEYTKTNYDVEII